MNSENLTAELRNFTKREENVERFAGPSAAQSWALIATASVLLYSTGSQGLGIFYTTTTDMNLHYWKLESSFSQSLVHLTKCSIFWVFKTRKRCLLSLDSPQLIMVNKRLFWLPTELPYPTNNVIHHTTCTCINTQIPPFPYTCNSRVMMRGMRLRLP